MKNPLRISLPISIACWLGFLIIFLKFPPTHQIIIAIQSLMLFLALSATFSSLIYAISDILTNKFVHRIKLFKESVRRGCLVSIAIMLIIVMKGTGIYQLFPVITLTLLLVAIEIYYSMFKQ